MRCTNCGWDNADQNTRCEKCNSLLGNSIENETRSMIRETVRETLREDRPIQNIDVDSPIEDPVQPTNQEPKDSPISSSPYPGTINPWGASQFGVPMMSYCKLTPMPSAPNEKHVPKEVELKGETIELNRGNLDPDNYTISNQGQAILSCKNGKWYIKDQSPYKTTFVLASEEMPIKNGDVILMGNRRFVFTEE